MKEEIEQQTVEFHERARKVFFNLYSAFRSAITSIDRQGEEDVFQQLHTRYTSQLNLQLHNIALELLSKQESNDRTKLNQALSQGIDEYINEFTQKIRSL